MAIDPVSPTEVDDPPAPGVYGPVNGSRPTPEPTDAIPPPDPPDGTTALPAQPVRAQDRTDVEGGNGRTFDYLPPDGTSALPPDATGAFSPSAAGSSPSVVGDHGPPPDLGRYRLTRFHARGGMGEIWLAEDTTIGRTVALKRMRPEARAHLDAFLWEAQITGQLEHPGIVPVHEFGAGPDDEPFYTMKFVHGRTMLEAIEAFHKLDRTDPAREVERVRLLQTFLAICQTMAYAHSRGVIHRDLKPGNVMTGEYGETLVLDWGLAKLVGADEQAEKAGPVRRYYSGETLETMVGSIKGTAAYMAPEAAAGDVAALDAVSDVYLLGGTLYHLLAGKKPRTVRNLPDLLAAAHRPPPPPRQHDPTCPRAIEAVCLKAMAVEKADRYPSAAALADDVQRFLAGEPVSAYRETFPERAWRWVRRHRQAVTRTAAAAAVVALTAVGVTKYREFEAEREADRRRLAEARRTAEELERQEQARRDRAAFRRLAEEAQFLAANTHPVAAAAPFFDARAGLAKGREALAVTGPWGGTLDQFPLADQRRELADEVYDLLLLMAQVRGGQSPTAAREVVPLLDRAAALRPPTRSYHRLRAAALAALGRPAEAAEESRRAADPATPATAADHFLLGEEYRVPLTRPEGLRDRAGVFRPNKAALEAAVEQYRQALRLDPRHYWSHNQLGRCLLSLDRGAEAVQALGACVALRPDAPWGYSARGVALTMLKRFPEAEADLARALELEPGSRLHQMNRGILTWQRGDPEASLADFDAALAPPSALRRPEAAFYKAQVLGQLGRPDDALAAADEALAAEHPPGSAYLFRAQVRLLLGDDKGGLADLDAFNSGGRPGYDPAGPAAAALRGHRLRLIAQELPAGQRAHRKAMLQLAEAQLWHAVQRGGGTAEAHDDLGAVLEHLGRTREAIEAYTRALGQDPPAELKLKTLVKRGWAYERLRPPALDKARLDFAAAIALAPDDPEAHTGLGYMLACQKAEAAARREAGRAVLVGAGDYLILHNVACVFAKLSEADPRRAAELEDVALDHLRRAVTLWKRDRSGPNELELIAGEPAFTKSLRARPEFRQILDEGP